MIIREAKFSDYDAVWEIFHAVIQSGDTYVFNPNTSKETLSQYWFASYMKTFVVEYEGNVAGTYIIKPNQIDLGNHLANCSYMVHPNFHRKRIGYELCEHSIITAKSLGYKAIQFNMVVSTNETAIWLWKKFGFKIIGTTPEGFQHSTLGLVDTHIMYLKL